VLWSEPWSWWVCRQSKQLSFRTKNYAPPQLLGKIRTEFVPTLFSFYSITSIFSPTLSYLAPKFSRHTDVFYPITLLSLPSFQCIFSTILSHFELHWDVTSLPKFASDWYNCSHYRSFCYSMASNRAVTKMAATSIAVFSINGVCLEEFDNTLRLLPSVYSWLHLQPLYVRGEQQQGRLCWFLHSDIYSSEIWLNHHVPVRQRWSNASLLSQSCHSPPQGIHIYV